MNKFNKTLSTRSQKYIDGKELETKNQTLLKKAWFFIGVIYSSVK